MAQLFLSLYRVIAKWSVGWSVAKNVKELLSKINNRQYQTLPMIKLDQYKQLFYRLKPSRASPDASDGASESPRF